MNIRSKNYIYLTGSVFVVSIQFLLAGVLVGNQFPVASRLYETVALEWMHMISPERELAYFRVFVIMAVIGQAAALNYFQDKLQRESFLAPLKYFFAIEFVITFYLLMSACQIAVYGETFVLRQTLFYVVVTLAVVHKLFFHEIRRYLQRCYSFLFKCKDKA